MKKLLIILLIIRTNIAYSQVPIEYDQYDDMPMTEEGAIAIVIISLLAAFFFGYLYGIDARNKQIDREKSEEIIAKEIAKERAKEIEETNRKDWENLSDKQKILWKELRTLNPIGATESEEARMIEIFEELDKLEI